MMRRAHLVPLSLLSLLPVILAAPRCSLTPPKTTGSTSPSISSGTANAAINFVASAWYEGWLGQVPSNFSWSKYTAMTFAFATTTPDVTQVALDDTSKQALPGFVSAAKDNDVKALLSIGGWTGSMYYSTAVATEGNRTAFVNTVTNLVTQYGLDGIDFDWEYPGKQGIGCNTLSQDDSANFLSFLQLLRKDPVGKNLILTAAVGITPFTRSDGNPMTNVSAFADVLDYIEIMAYDVWGTWSPTVGPNAPLNDTCAPSADRVGSAVSAVNAWTAAGFPVSQISLGVPSYGRGYSVDKSNAVTTSGQLAIYSPYNLAQTPPAPGETNTTTTDQCGNPQPGASGVFDFRDLVAQGYLTGNGTAADGIEYQFDECSQTAFIYNPQNQVMFSFDDHSTFEAKGQYIESVGLRGFSMWHATGDYNDVLLDAISDGMGIESVCPS